MAPCARARQPLQKKRALLPVVASISCSPEGFHLGHRLQRVHHGENLVVRHCFKSGSVSTGSLSRLFAAIGIPNLRNVQTSKDGLSSSPDRRLAAFATNPLEQDFIGSSSGRDSVLPSATHGRQERTRSVSSRSVLTAAELPRGTEEGTAGLKGQNLQIAFVRMTAR